MNRNNKTRLLKTLEILRRKTDIDHHLTLKQIGAILNEMDIEASERKTFYDDVKILNNEGIEVEHEIDGYYLKDAPFSLSEIKILTDSINSLKTIDERMLEEIRNKLYSFVSEYDERFLKEIELSTKHKNAHFLESLEDVLMAIRENAAVTAVRAGKSEKETVFPVFLYRDRDHYYFVYHYRNKEKLYRFRFDTLKEVTVSEEKDEMTISADRIRRYLDESTSSYNTGNGTLVKLELKNRKRERQLLDDFPGIEYSNEGYYYFSADINDQFFARLAGYADDILIRNKDIRKEYRRFLNRIIDLY